MTPIDTFILKIASRCNINCKYCYMYNKADQSWRQQPRFMSMETMRLAARKIADHAEVHQLKTVSVIYHGGEPLLAGQQFFTESTQIFRQELASVENLHILLQTNGILLATEWLDLLADLRIGIGISIDGLPSDHDKNRVTHTGEGTHAQVVRAIRLCQEHERTRNHFGILSVINAEADPVATFDHFMDLGIKYIDFLFPDNTHDTLPNYHGTPYGDWLVKVFNRWYELDDPAISIRMFDGFIRLMLGENENTDIWGLGPVTSAVIETDGGIEPLDVLKSCGEDFTKIGLNVLFNSVEDVYQNEVVQLLQGGESVLCDTCRSCDLLEACGGGYAPWRYSQEQLFNQPAVYCADIKKLVEHIYYRIAQSIGV